MSLDYRAPALTIEQGARASPKTSLGRGGRCAAAVLLFVILIVVFFVRSGVNPTSSDHERQRPTTITIRITAMISTADDDYDEDHDEDPQRPMRITIKITTKMAHRQQTVDRTAPSAYLAGAASRQMLLGRAQYFSA